MTHGKDTVWEYVNPAGSGGSTSQGDPPSDNRVFKIRRYPPDFPAFAGRDLTPGDPVELFNSPFPVPTGSLFVSKQSESGDSIRIDWDASSCPSFDYHLLVGDLAEVSTQGLLGAECNLGLSGTHVIPGRDLPPFSRLQPAAPARACVASGLHDGDGFRLAR